MQEYTGLKTLYLEQNAILVIENLDKLVNLRCLYLGKNMISEITGLEALTALETLDLSDNYIEKVSGLSGLPVLRTLTLSGNKMRSIADVQHLEQCSALTSLDLSNCRLEDTAVVDMVIRKPLSYLRLQGNPCVSSYRYCSVSTVSIFCCADTLQRSQHTLRGQLLIRHTRPNIHRNYRKTIVAAMPSLNYLDDMPVFPKDRRYAVAFIEGGVEAERR
jgi:Leucine-rich repeat (LRR) protein